jgi:hypothetical protein
MEINTAKQKNRLIKQFLVINIIAWIIFLFVFPGIIMEIILESAIFIWFIVKYFKNKKNKDFNLEHDLLINLKIKEFSFLDINAGLVIGQFILGLTTTLYSGIENLSFLAKIILILPMVLIAVVFKEEYKKNNKIIKSRN